MTWRFLSFVGPGLFDGMERAVRGVVGLRIEYIHCQ